MVAAMRAVGATPILVAVWLGLLPATAGAGVTLHSPVGYNTDSNPTSLALGDINGDGSADIVSSNNGGGTATVLLGHADGTFTVPGSYPSALPHMAAPGPIALGHFLGTWHLDIADLQVGVPYQVDLLPGTATGAFGAIAASPPAPSAYTSEMGTGVLTTTGKEGIVLGDQQHLDVFVANGDGTFTTEQSPTSPGFSPNSL